MSQMIAIIDAHGATVTVPVLPPTGPAAAANSLPVTIASDAGVLPVINSGSTGADHSANASVVPLAGYTLLTSIAANINRANVGVQNQSLDMLQVVRDNGSGGQVTVLLLAPSPGASSQGAPGQFWSSVTFKGRVQIYGPTGSQVAAYED